MSLERDLTAVLNRYSAENRSNTPDFILAQFLLQCLAAYNSAVSAREARGVIPVEHSVTHVGANDQREPGQN